MKRLGGAAVCAAVIAAAPSLRGQPAPATIDEAVQRFEAAAGGAEVVRSATTGLVTYMSDPDGGGVPVSAPAGAAPEERAMAFMGEYGAAFGITDVSQLAVSRVERQDPVGMEHVRMRQVWQGVPVTGGELYVHLRRNTVVSVNGLTLPGADRVDVTPQIVPAAAAEAARAAVAARAAGDGNFEVSEPRLEIFNRGLLEGAVMPTRLAWFVEVRRLDVREYVWVDATFGSELLRFSQITRAKNRQVHDGNSTSTLPGTLVRSEGGPPSGITDVNDAYTYSGDTYDYFFNTHGRDSYDNAGAVLRSTVRHCPSGGPCPYANAFWNGSQMVYGAGFPAADDVDAHELTHAVTEFTAGLFYYMQSGALNESLSDIFGETVDLLNTGGTDTPGVRWLLGEDVPGFGAIRNMMNPAAFSDPAKVTGDPNFVCESPGGDAGGVHANSGVPNHFYALAVDGGTYNGQTITGIGLDKAGRIVYRALAMYMLSASDFLEFYNVVRRSCSDLIGVAGITLGDCNNVRRALDAVELNKTWPCAPTQPAPTALCPIGTQPTYLFNDNLEAGSANWSINVLAGSNLWYYLNWFATSGSFNLLGDNPNTIHDGRAFMNTSVMLPGSGVIRAQFNHSYGFENDAFGTYDGGRIEYSTNHGASWNDAGPLISGGAAYSGTIANGFGNPLAGQQAFVNHSFGYTNTQLNLATLAGQPFRLAFRIGTDSCCSDYGWYIDDVRVYTCAANADHIFSSGHEAGDPPFSIVQTDGGDLAFQGAPAALQGSVGMRLLVDDTNSIFVEDTTPNNESAYFGMFLMNPGTFDPGEAMGRFRMRPFLGLDQSPTTRRAFVIVLRRLGGIYSIMARVARDDGSRVNTGFFEISNATHSIKYRYVRSTAPGANNGQFQLWIDGALVSTLTGIDNDTYGIDAGRLGALSVKLGANGTFYQDYFSSWRTTDPEIPIPVPTATEVEGLTGRPHQQ
jgi:Zn-dependent metalloprotease